MRHVDVMLVTHLIVFFYGPTEGDMVDSRFLRGGGHESDETVNCHTAVIVYLKLKKCAKDFLPRRCFFREGVSSGKFKTPSFKFDLNSKVLSPTTV